MERKVHLPLYGDIEYSKHDLAWQLFQTPAMARLRDLSLSSLPARFTPLGMPASRFSHSVGVSYLAQLLASWHPRLQEHSEVLIAAALLHDAGSPPFSHIAEPFLFAFNQKTHEQQVQHVLAEPNIKHLLESKGVNPQRVLQTILGKENLLGKLLAGSIDLDNFDNSLHLLLSFGYTDLPYHPLKLLQAWVIEEEITLDSSYMDQLLGWRSARKQLYTILQDDVQLSSTSMLYRALESAFSNGYLGEDFFWKNESEAIVDLQNSTDTAHYLIQRASLWQQYKKAWGNKFADSQELHLAATDWQIRKEINDKLCEACGVSEKDLVFYLGKEKTGEKAISIPFVGMRKKEAEHRLKAKPGSWFARVYVNKNVKDYSSKDWKRIWSEIFSSLDFGSAKPAPHLFF